ncbi:hypothetical protein JOD43_001041 [Pullulanibacillus pueri]|uniref:Lipoprotein n=1 Tax=Pullulanibacillus pueri TaxID=1437324 RepID=A0A8J2ZVU2_9BACL|nr:hypothetical protein [Pullulanibacillus pueri]MBM7680875.1 hypothetical protein [Pullulanibacillus pueri]GGH81175.1 hypothetical protein GCM10007096_18670 [Pullulanibacillus pueri]
MKVLLYSLFISMVILTENVHLASGRTSFPNTSDDGLLTLNDKELIPYFNQTLSPHSKLGETCNKTVSSQEALTKNKTDLSNGPLKKYRIVSYYGHPKSSRMGILGQLSPNELVSRLKKQAQAYSKLDPCHPAIPAIELITTVAQRTPGANGLYYHKTSSADIERYATLAKENGMLLILDVQLGRDSIIHQVQMLNQYLKLPYVSLAIDTEFHVRARQTPGVQLGHVDGNHIQTAVRYINDLIEKNHLPDKVIIVHQFKYGVIGNKHAIKPTNHVEVVLNFDGFGRAKNKKDGYRLLVKNQPVQYGGFKLFYKQDTPLLTPKDVLNLDPTPVFIDYQ